MHLGASLTSRRQFLAALAAAPVPVPRPSSPLERLGASTACLPGTPLVPALRRLRELGFSTVELIGFRGARNSAGDVPGVAFHRLSGKELDEVADAVRPFRHIAMHLPFHELHPFSWNEDIREFAIDLFKKGLDGLFSVGGKQATVHVGDAGQGRTYKDIWKSMIDTFKALGDYAAAKRIRIGIETMQPTSVADYTRLILEVNHPAVGATIDTGHIRGASDIGLPPERRDSDEGRKRFNDVLLQTVERLGDKVMHLHLTDVKGRDWKDHQTVGSGIIDFPRLFAQLKKQNFGGLMVFELEEADPEGALRKSKEYVEKVLLSQAR